MGVTRIEWTATRMPDGSLRPGYTMNFWIGCQEVSPACDFCYARVQNEHRKWVVGWGPDGERRRTGYWKDARRWNRTARALGIRLKVFSNSLSDFFDKAVDDTGMRDDAWQVINECRNLDWLILTKRPQNITNRLPAGWMEKQPDGTLAPWPHVWFGTTTENQKEADRRIPHLLAVPAKVHFLSGEPLLGLVDLTTTEGWLWRYGGRLREPVNGWPDHPPRRGGGIDWVIAGGESGPNARPSHPDWFRSLRDQCQAAGVPFFFKQWGEWAPLASGIGHAGFVAKPGGRRAFINHDGKPMTERQADNAADSDQPAQCWHVGKKTSGALLDGVEHKEWPDGK